jgi:hypothetical protein
MFLPEGVPLWSFTSSVHSKAPALCARETCDNLRKSWIAQDASSIPRLLEQFAPSARWSPKSHPWLLREVLQRENVSLVQPRQKDRKSRSIRAFAEHSPSIRRACYGSVRTWLHNPTESCAAISFEIALHPLQTISRSTMPTQWRLLPPL